MPWYRLWAVINEWKDVSDVASIRELRSYRLLDCPYKFLKATDKKTIEEETVGMTAPHPQADSGAPRFQRRTHLHREQQQEADLHGSRFGSAS